MKRPVSSPYGWAPGNAVVNEQCVCCKEEIPAGAPLVISRQPQSAGRLCIPCRDQYRRISLDTGYLAPLFTLPRYRPEGRISTQEKQSRAARERELAKGHVLKV